MVTHKKVLFWGSTVASVDEVATRTGFDTFDLITSGILNKRGIVTEKRSFVKGPGVPRKREAFKRGRNGLWLKNLQVWKEVICAGKVRTAHRKCNKLTAKGGQIDIVFRLQEVFVFSNFSHGVACVEDDSEGALAANTQAKVIHKQTMRPTLVEVLACFPEKWIDTKLQVELLALQLRGVLCKSRLGSVSCLSPFLGWFVRVGIVRGWFLILGFSSVRSKVTKKFPCLGTDAIHTACPDLDTTI